METLSNLSEEKVPMAVRYANFLKTKINVWDRLHREICKHEKKGDWLRIHRIASSIIDEINRYRSECGLDKDWCIERGLFSPGERLAFFNRTQARMRGLNNPRGAIEDFTEALSYYQAFWKLDYGDIDTYMVEHLYDRAQCHIMLEDLESAYEDLRACCSGIRAIGDDWSGLPSIPPNIVKTMLMIMAKQKLLSGASRPFYTQNERDSIERDLGLNAFDRDNYHCLQCGAGPSEVALKRCGSCMRVWFCGPACQKRTWTEGHKDSCPSLEHHVQVCRDQDKAAMDKDFDSFGSVTWTTSDKG